MSDNSIAYVLGLVTGAFIGFGAFFAMGGIL